MVALGMFAGVWSMGRTAKRLGVDPKPFEEATFWVLLMAFIGARLAHFLFYAPLSEFAGIIRLWETGWSSMGGIMGGIIGFFVVRKRFFPNVSFARAADIATCSLPIGMAVGRIGCFLIHDHPGTLSHFVLAVNFPGGARHDLALYESLAMFALAAVLAMNGEKLLKHEGRLARTIGMSYALVRFPLDFLREIDVRYFGLTPAQYGCLAMIAVILFVSRRKSATV
jgi:phosphatidylglycerol:prolipoprotein diacylglycerol transferase